MGLTNDLGAGDGEERTVPVGDAKLDIAEHVDGGAGDERERKGLSSRNGERVDVDLLHMRIYISNLSSRTTRQEWTYSGALLCSRHIV